MFPLFYESCLSRCACARKLLQEIDDLELRVLASKRPITTILWSQTDNTVTKYLQKMEDIVLLLQAAASYSQDVGMCVYLSVCLPLGYY